MNVLQELKTSTEDLHRGIETMVPLMNPRLTMAEYSSYLERIFPFYDAVETHLARLPGLRERVIDLDERWKKGALAADLAALGSSPFLSFSAVFVPELKTVPQALGCLYVLEGSTLGGQILVRAVRSALGAAVEGKTRFLASYGTDVPQKWRGLCAVLSAALNNPDDKKAAVQSARATFSALHNWLVESRNRIEQRDLVAR